MGVISNGTTLLDAGALDSGVATGAMTLLSTQTASTSATISFTSGIDSTYDSYVFKFYDIHPANDNADFSFQVDTGTNTSYNQTITSTCFESYHNEADSDTTLGYSTAGDLAQSTSFQPLVRGIGNDNDQSGSGELSIYSPSSTTFVKHFMANGNLYLHNDYSRNMFVAGYVNTTTALTRVQFKFNSGNIDSGTIKLYGIK